MKQPGLYAKPLGLMSVVLCGMLVLLPGTRLLAAGKRRSAVPTTMLGAECRVAPDPRQDFARYVRFRPGDGQEVRLNPPRFSWPYVPEIVLKSGRTDANMLFTLRISKRKDCAHPEVEVKDTPYNFYNFLPPLDDGRTWYWRVGYKAGKQPVRWSAVRSFTLADDAVVWDRSRFGETLDAVHGHPRILFNRANRAAVLGIRTRNEYSDVLAKKIINEANATLKKQWYRRFPKTDKKPMVYMSYSAAMVNVGFAYMLTGDEKYAGVKDRLVTMASWPKGGYSSPEGLVAHKWNTHLTEHMGMLYDWLYDDLTPAERTTVRRSLEWRLDWTLNSFAWRVNDGKTVNRGSIAAQCASHPYQNIMAIIPGALAICDESPIAREVLEVGVHYVIGITNAHGEDEGWMDGAGYGNGKMKWLMNATWTLQTAIPELELGKNRAYSAYTDFFARLTPIGATHTSFGNRGYNERDWASSRIHNFRAVAILRQDGYAMQNWLDTGRRMADVGRAGTSSSSPYIEYVLPYYAREPKARPEDNPVRLFPVEGWVSVSSAPPSDYDAQKEAVSMVFACRTRGGTGHSFRCENGFDIHAYGETIAAGGGSTYNLNKFANDTMSHNSVLVNGREQEAARERNVRTCGRIVAFRQGANFVYWAGDATAAYGEKTGLGKFIRHVAFVDNAYFVIYDELEMRPGHEPATFQWLYHIPEYVPVDFDPRQFVIKYKVGHTRVVIQHLANVADLELTKFRGIEGWDNPITGKSYRELGSDMTKKIKTKEAYGISKRPPKPVDANHLWVTHKTPRRSMRFLSAIVPYRDGEVEPTIRRVSAAAVCVSFRDKETVVSFDKSAPGDLTVDVTDLSE